MMEPSASVAFEEEKPVSLLTETLAAIRPVLAVPLVQACPRILQEVATFDSAGVTDRG